MNPDQFSLGQLMVARLRIDLAVFAHIWPVWVAIVVVAIVLQSTRGRWK